MRSRRTSRRAPARLAAQLNATLSNAAKSEASALYGAGGSAAGFVLTSNLVAAGADARLVNPTSTSTAVGDVTIEATDNAGIYANTKLVSSSVTTNTGGLDILRDTLDTASDLANPPRYYSSDGLEDSSFPLTFGDRVQVKDGYTVDVEGEEIEIPAGVYKYLGASGNFAPTTEDYLDLDFWQAETSASGLIPDIGNVTASDAIAVGGMVVRNQVESGAVALVTGATLTAGSLSVTAKETSTMVAELDSFVESSGGSNTGDGQSVAKNGAIATNLVIGSATAEIRSSDITTTGAGDSDGSVSVIAENDASMEAIGNSVTLSGDKAFGASLAFNTVGYEPQNLLLATLDALMGTNIGDQQPAEASALILNSTISAAGDVAVRADNTASIDAELLNDATSAASALTGGATTRPCSHCWWRPAPASPPPSSGRTSWTASSASSRRRWWARAARRSATSGSPR